MSHVSFVNSKVLLWPLWCLQKFSLLNRSSDLWQVVVGINEFHVQHQKTTKDIFDLFTFGITSHVPLYGYISSTIANIGTFWQQQREGITILTYPLSKCMNGLGNTHLHNVRRFSTKKSSSANRQVLGNAMFHHPRVVIKKLKLRARSRLILRWGRVRKTPMRN